MCHIYWYVAHYINLSLCFQNVFFVYYNAAFFVWDQFNNSTSFTTGILYQNQIFLHLQQGMS